MRTQIAASTDVCVTQDITPRLCREVSEYLQTYESSTQLSVHAHTQIRVPLAKLLGVTFIRN